MGNLRIKVWVLLDACPPDYEKMVASILSDVPLEFVKLPGEGNAATFARQIDLLKQQEKADLVYFAEDDYLHLPGALERGAAFLERHPEADALTLADHSDYHRRYVDRFLPATHGERPMLAQGGGHGPYVHDPAQRALGGGRSFEDV